MKKLAILLALAISSPAVALDVAVDTWPGIGTNRQLDSLRCYALAFAPADQQRATYTCQNGSCTARVTVPWLGGYTTLRTTAPAGFTRYEVVTGGGTWLATLYTSSPSGDTIISHWPQGGPGSTPIGECTYPNVAPVGKVARRVGGI
jgi:hypothetical protein